MHNIEHPNLINHNGELYFIPNYLSTHSSQTLFNTILQNIHFQQLPIKLFGREYLQPRRIAFQSIDSIPYTYSRQKMVGTPIIPEVKILLKKIEFDFGEKFNSILYNLYEHGEHSMGWHSDDEKELGKNPTIFSINLGGERTMLFRPKAKYIKTMARDHTLKKVLLTPGSLLIMKGEMQHFWQHSIPKTKQITLPRINLTFRKILL